MYAYNDVRMDNFEESDLFAGSPLPLMDSFRGGFL